MQLLSTNDKAYNNYKSGVKLHRIGNIITLSGLGIFGYSCYKAMDKGDLDILYSGSLVGGLVYIGGAVLKINGSAKVRNAIKTYNKSTDITYDLNINSNGIGLVMQF